MPLPHVLTTGSNRVNPVRSRSPPFPHQGEPSSVLMYTRRADPSSLIHVRFNVRKEGSPPSPSFVSPEGETPRFDARRRQTPFPITSHTWYITDSRTSPALCNNEGRLKFDAMRTLCFCHRVENFLSRSRLDLRARFGPGNLKRQRLSTHKKQISYSFKHVGTSSLISTLMRTRKVSRPHCAADSGVEGTHSILKKLFCN